MKKCSKCGVRGEIINDSYDDEDIGKFIIQLECRMCGWRMVGAVNLEDLEAVPPMDDDQ